MNAEKLMKETYPTIEFDDKWDYLAQRFSADDMIYFANLYAQKQNPNAALPPVNERVWTVDEIISVLETSEDADEHARWFDKHGR